MYLISLLKQEFDPRARLDPRGVLSNALIAVGIVVGSVLAGKISGDRIESGLIPLGLAGIAGSLLAMQIDPTSVVSFRACLIFIGVSSGLFSIPIRGLLQTRPAESERGAVLGLSSMIDFTGILVASGVYYLFEKVFELSQSHTFKIPRRFIIAHILDPKLIFRSGFWFWSV